MECPGNLPFRFLPGKFAGPEFMELYSCGMGTQAAQKWSVKFIVKYLTSVSQAFDFTEQLVTGRTEPQFQSVLPTVQRCRKCPIVDASGFVCVYLRVTLLHRCACK